MASESEDKSYINLDVGNILSGQEVKVAITMLQTLRIEGGAYAFTLPVSYFPEFLDLNTGSESFYSFDMEIDIHSKSQITYLSCPEYIQME